MRHSVDDELDKRTGGPIVFENENEICKHCEGCLGQSIVIYTTRFCR